MNKVKKVEDRVEWLNTKWREAVKHYTCYETWVHNEEEWEYKEQLQHESQCQKCKIRLKIESMPLYGGPNSAEVLMYLLPKQWEKVELDPYISSLISFAQKTVDML